MNIVLIGAGNVATHLGAALQEKGFSIAQVYSRTRASARSLGEKLQTSCTDRLTGIFPDADVYLFSVKDAVLEDVIRQIPENQGLWIHTAGSIPMNIFEKYVQRYGVLYPLQTFGKNRKITFDHIPLFIETNWGEDEKILTGIASLLSDTVVPLSSEKRKYLHLAAVFACNFTNHLYSLSAQILEKQDLPWNYLLPLIEETALKIKTLHPNEAQTGPAVRYDTNVLDKHLALLSNDLDKQLIYKILSESIHRM